MEKSEITSLLGEARLLLSQPASRHKETDFQRMQRDCLRDLQAMQIRLNSDLVTIDHSPMVQHVGPKV